MNSAKHLDGRASFTAQQKRYLHELGLSDDAIRVYELLFEHGPLTAQAVAQLTGTFPSAVYRLFYRLEHFGLIGRRSARPMLFAAMPVEMGYTAALAVRQHEIQSILAQCFDEEQMDMDHPLLKLVVGRKALYAEYARMAPRAQKTIDAYTIGIAHSDMLVAVQRAAIKRGVYIRHVIQQLQPSNYHVAHGWQRMGVNLRLNKAERGFHIMIFDSTKTIVTFSDPTDTESRLSIVTDSQAVANMFGAHFNAIWQAAKVIRT